MWKDITLQSAGLRAWVEQKNGAVIRRLVGYRRYQGFEAATLLAELYASARLFVNVFQPSFKLASKSRTGARVTKRYHPPAKPCRRLLAHPATSADTKAQLTALESSLDPVALLARLRELQAALAALSDGVTLELVKEPAALSEFLAGLRIAWKSGETRPTAIAKAKPARYWRSRIDPFAAVAADLDRRFAAAPGSRDARYSRRYRPSTQAYMLTICCGLSSGALSCGGTRMQSLWSSILALFNEVAAIDKECARINACAPPGARHLSGVELRARNLREFTRDTPSFTDKTQLADPNGSGRLVWPPPRPLMAAAFAETMMPASARRFSGDWWEEREQGAARQQAEQQHIADSYARMTKEQEERENAEARERFIAHQPKNGA